MAQNNGLMVTGFQELRNDIARMAQELDANSTTSTSTTKALKNAAIPVHRKMKQNASVDPKIDTGALHAALKIGNVKKRASSGKTITIGVHRKDWKSGSGDDKEYYPAYVEYGHGGPGPAPAHPYIRPAYDATEQEAYTIIRNELRNALNKLTH